MGMTVCILVASESCSFLQWQFAKVITLSSLSLEGYLREARWTPAQIH